MKYVKGDICLTQIEDVIHGCNAQGKMGSGVALAIRNAFPGCYEYYRDALNEEKEFEASILGTDFTFEVEGMLAGPKRIHNLITQEFYGKDGAKYARYLYVAKGIWDICANSSATQFAIPKIGCSLGGLKWEVVEELLREVEEDLKVEFTVYYI